jgi:hypothetical protein
VPALPLRDFEVDSTRAFAADELLYRRVLPSEELEEGEIDPTRFNSLSFKKELDGAPSVLRSQFASPQDALHPDCAGPKDVSQQRVYSIRVDELPGVIKSRDGKEYNVYPLHRPLPTCGAHSVIGSCMAGDLTKTYAVPSQTARNDLRVKLAAGMKRLSLVKNPNPQDVTST